MGGAALLLLVALVGLVDADTARNHSLAQPESCHTVRVEEAASTWLLLHPPLAITTPRAAAPCAAASRRFLRELQRLQLWAALMHDATAKLPSGLLNGNVNQFGDFDQCLSVAAEGPRLRGQYCLAALEARLQGVSALAPLHRKAHSHYLFTSTLHDPGHRVPRYSSILWGVCIPDACSAADLQAQLEDTLTQQAQDTGLMWRVHVDPAMCQLKTTWDLPDSAFIVSSMFIAIVVIALGATYYDMKRKNQQVSNGILTTLFLCFSLKKTTRTLLNTTRASDDIESIHGIRAVNALMLLLAHKAMALFFNPYMNRTEMAESVAQPWTVLARGASLYTDLFIMLSGLLSANTFLKQLERKKKMNILTEYISRLFRIVPNLGAIILFCTYVLPWMGSGPQWNLVVRHHSEICKNTWWRNLLFIHNYFGFHNMCLTHTHHLGIDTQLFFLSPLLVYIMWKWPKKGVAAVIGLAVLSTAARFYVTYTRNLVQYVHFGASVGKLFETADYSYILPSHRATVYILGMLLAYFIRLVGRNYKLKEMHITFGWVIAALMFSASFLMPSAMGNMEYQYRAIDNANYAAFAPIGWCLFYAWIIFISYVGKAGRFCNWLSWNGFLVTTRLSYALYLTQFPVYFYNVGMTRHVDHYTIRVLFNGIEMMTVWTATLMLTLFIDLPFQNIRNMIFKKQKDNLKEA